MKITFGKHKGSNIADIPESYLEWGAERLESPIWRKAFERELSRRKESLEEKKN